MDIIGSDKNPTRGNACEERQTKTGPMSALGTAKDNVAPVVYNSSNLKQTKPTIKRTYLMK